MRNVLILTVLVACGGGGLGSGLPQGKLASELTPAEACDLQQAMGEYAEERLDPTTTCYVNARFSASFQVDAGIAADFTEACETAFDACVAAGEGEEGFFEFEECEEAEVQVPAGCTVTVGEFETCFADTIDGFRDWGQLDCGSPDEPVPELFGAESCDTVRPCIET